MPKSAQVRTVIQTLVRDFPGKGAVELERAEDVLLATVLSARTRDEQVLKVYPKLRRAFPKLEDLAAAEPSEIANVIKEIGLYRAKARSVKGIAQSLIRRHRGRVPRTLEALVDLPGVGRKTANCVLCYAFKIPAIAVDTHVQRVTNRLGWVKTTRPEDTEAALLRLIPRDLWLHVNRVFVKFGRTICLPGRPKCYACPVRRFCAYPHKTEALATRSAVSP